MKLFLALALGGTSLVASQTAILATPNPVTFKHPLGIHFNPPPPPPDPPPGGRVLGGAKRGICPQVKPELTALVPFTQKTSSLTNVWALTTVAHPTLWFYVPDYRNSTYPAEFVLQNEDSNPIYQKAIALPDRPGVIGISLPTTVSPLALNKRYRWFFNIYCDQEKQSPPIYVEGVIQRVSLSQATVQQLQTAQPQQQAAIYAQNGIWHDALTILAQLRQKNPQNVALQTEWRSLLTSIGLGEVATQSIILRKPNSSAANLR
ncbi:MAG: DUF928 domain-containing protein [Mojavia pulchra JT2-VF2]|jgi:hypothetical protein|uniref:DUF928 domain-containing protein n=1 Tax=Mojavia pulchra JT2-VF2 TaxID=287848 RepID=A0A951PZN8_9NOST|nr:DUF928 domain-containing protein [Mojavia pulchra JT2-VF2]